MRTTLTLEDDIQRELQDLAARQRKSFKSVVNSVLRKGLRVNRSQMTHSPFIKIDTVNLTYRSGVDEVKLNELLDDLSVEELSE